MHVILGKPLWHDGWYWFKFNKERLFFFSHSRHATLLNDYCHRIMTEKLPDLFEFGPRASRMRTPRCFVSSVTHPITKFASASLLYRGEYANNHARVQNFLLENESRTIAIELPVWFQNGEGVENLTGHIDVLRLTDKIEIWDYKPAADKERYASSQLYWYARMLSARLNVPLAEMRCGYFDEKKAFVFEF